MPVIDIIYIVKPEHPHVLHMSEHMLNFFQQVCLRKGIQMQFELIHEGLLVFWKTLEDYEKMHELLANFPIKNIKDFSPSSELEPWKIKIIWNTTAPLLETVKRCISKINVFLGQFGRVEICEKEKEFIIYFPVNFSADIYLDTTKLDIKN